MTSAFRNRPNLAIQPRNYMFGRERAPERWWLAGDPVASAIFDALSATFPQGERFFMDSLRAFRGKVPPELEAQIGGFIAQEALHTREHVVFNGHIRAQGRDLAAMEERSRQMLDIARARPAFLQLAVTVSLEHFTAILAHLLLSDERYLAGADEETARLWRWHALEEIEHKAVAFDTLMHVLRRLPRHRRWLLRTGVMIDVTRRFLQAISANVLQILREDGLDDAKTRRALWRYLLVSPGAALRILPLYLSYFAPGFHPWKHDDRALIGHAEAGLAA
jgi:uncharacterized protein